MEFNKLALLMIPLAIIITWFFLDLVRKLSIKFKVFAVPNERSSHDSIIPATGGVALCISWIILIIIYSVLVEQDIGVELYFYVLAGVLISIVGFYDDLNELPSFVKLLLQIFIFFIISFGDNSLINSFHGILGIYELSYFESLGFSLFVFIVIVNAINLVDGIDGLSGSLTLFFLIITSYFYFKSNYHYNYLVVAFCFSLSVFLFFNYSERKKIFLGDTGSLGLGLCVAVLSLGYLNTDHPTFNLFPINQSLFVVLMIAYPLLDVIRVFILRIYNGKSFMMADRNHIHHKLIDIGLSHKKAVFVIILSQISLLAFNVIVIPQINLHIQILINGFIIASLLLSLYLIPNK